MKQRSVNPHEPYAIRDGLAVYRFGKGKPLLWVPYPHADEVIGDPTPSLLTKQLVALGCEVISFDPPGSGRSTRAMQLSMAEMLACAKEALEVCGVHDAVDVLGHSQGAITALAFTLETPTLVRRLVLVGGAAGGASYFKASGFIGNRNHPQFWKMALTGILYILTRRRAAEILMCNVLFKASFVDKRHFIPTRVSLKDWFLPARPRTWWSNVARQLDYRSHLEKVQVPTLLLIGRHDAVCPLICSQELAREILDSTLVIFEQSGHAPFIEEPEAFAEKLKAFLGTSVIEKAQWKKSKPLTKHFVSAISHLSG